MPNAVIKARIEWLEQPRKGGVCFLIQLDREFYFVAECNLVTLSSMHNGPDAMMQAVAEDQEYQAAVAKNYKAWGFPAVN